MNDDFKIVCESDPEWTQHDTEMCEKGEKSGTAIWLKTGKPLTFDELNLIAREFDEVRGTISVDDFMKQKGIGSKPMTLEGEG